MNKRDTFGLNAFDSLSSVHAIRNTEKLVSEQYQDTAPERHVALYLSSNMRHKKVPFSVAVIKIHPQQ